MPEAVVDGELAFDPDAQRCAVVLCRTEHGNLDMDERGDTHTTIRLITEAGVAAVVSVTEVE